MGKDILRPPQASRRSIHRVRLPVAMGNLGGARRQLSIVSVSGDGGFGQYALSFTTAVKVITHVLADNQELGNISKKQRPLNSTCGRLRSTGDFAAFADLCGAKGIQVTSIAEFDEALNAGLDHDGSALIDVVTDSVSSRGWPRRSGQLRPHFRQLPIRCETR